MYISDDWPWNECAFGNKIQTLRKNFLYLEFLRSVFSCIRTECDLRIQFKCRKKEEEKLQLRLFFTQWKRLVVHTILNKLSQLTHNTPKDFFKDLLKWNLTFIYKFHCDTSQPFYKGFYGICKIFLRYRKQVRM